MNIVEKLKEFIIVDLLNAQDKLNLEDEQDLLTLGLLDSMAIMRLIAFIEEEFKIDVPVEEVTIENFRTLVLISNYIQRRQSLVNQ